MTPAEMLPGMVPEMFAGPRKLRRLIPVLRRCPRNLAEGVLAVVALGDGVRRGRYSSALRWAAAQGLTGPTGHRTALALLANHGRFVAEEALLGVRDMADLARNVDIDGAEHLPAAPGGALLLGFHLGPPKTWMRLRALGYPVRFAGRLASAGRDVRWQAALDAGAVIRLPDGDAGSRVRSLLHMRRLLADGALVYVTADGPFGRTAFSIDLPGGPLVVRQGWLALRRATQVPTLPVLTWRDGGRRIIRIHPPLPPVDDDARRDAEACQAVLAPLIEAYVRQHPTQCRWVAMPRWPQPSGVDHGAPDPADQQVADD